MYDELSLLNEFTLLMMWHLFFLVIFMGTKSVKSLNSATEFLEPQDMTILKYIFVNFNYLQIIYCLLQWLSSFLFIIFNGNSSGSETKSGRIIYSMSELYEKFRTIAEGIVSCWIY